MWSSFSFENIESKLLNMSMITFLVLHEQNWYTRKKLRNNVDKFYHLRKRPLPVAIDDNCYCAVIATLPPAQTFTTGWYWRQLLLCSHFNFTTCANVHCWLILTTTAIVQSFQLYHLRKRSLLVDIDDNCYCAVISTFNPDWTSGNNSHCHRHALVMIS